MLVYHHYSFIYSIIHSASIYTDYIPCARLDIRTLGDTMFQQYTQLSEMRESTKETFLETGNHAFFGKRNNRAFSYPIPKSQAPLSPHTPHTHPLPRGHRHYLCWLRTLLIKRKAFKSFLQCRVSFTANK